MGVSDLSFLGVEILMVTSTRHSVDVPPICLVSDVEELMVRGPPWMDRTLAFEHLQHSNFNISSLLTANNG